MIDLFRSRPDPLAALRTVLRDTGRGVACLIGTQAAGKSIFAEYLRVRAVEGQHNLWSLDERFEAALGGIKLAPVRPKLVVPFLEQTPDAAAGRGPNIERKQGSKSITVWEPVVENARVRGTAFIDVPGEASSLLDPGAAKPAGLAPETILGGLRDVIEASNVVVLFVPVWSLLPQSWLVEHGAAALGQHLAATSLVGESGRAPTAEELASVCHQTVAQTDGWRALLESHARRGAHLVVVLSQFQRETVEKLFDACSHGTSKRSLGTSTWDRLARTYRAASVPAPSMGALPRLGASLRAVDDAAFELIHATRAVARERGESCPVAASLANLVAAPETESVAATRMRARFGSVSVLPLNVVSIQSAEECIQWAAKTRYPDRDHRGCEDVLWTMLLRRHAADLWEP